MHQLLTKAVCMNAASMFVLENYLVLAEAAFHVEYYSTLIGAR